MARKSHPTIGLGGTFDHLHVGHEHFILFAAQLADKLKIGVATDKLTQGKAYSHLIQPYKVRKSAVANFCKKHEIDCEISELTDVYGPTLTDDSIKAICITKNTIAGAQQINTVRERMNKRELTTYVCPLLEDKSGQIISSTRIRQGEINRTGQEYLQVVKTDLTLNAEQRAFFQTKQGVIVDHPRPSHSLFTCVVGDTSLALFRKKYWEYTLGVFDKKELRVESHLPEIESITDAVEVVNPAGTIAVGLVSTLRDCLTHQRPHLFVNGEEDLAMVALVLSLPLYSLIYYGQPGEGLVETEVTEEIKEKFFQVLSQK